MKVGDKVRLKLEYNNVTFRVISDLAWEVLTIQHIDGHLISLVGKTLQYHKAYFELVVDDMVFKVGDKVKLKEEHCDIGLDIIRDLVGKVLTISKINEAMLSFIDDILQYHKSYFELVEDERVVLNTEFNKAMGFKVGDKVKLKGNGRVYTVSSVRDDNTIRVEEHNFDCEARNFIPYVEEKEEKEKKTLYNLKLHEELMINLETTVMRVPGGWIYTSADSEEVPYEYTKYTKKPISSLFVPWNGEYQDENRR